MVMIVYPVAEFKSGKHALKMVGKTSMTTFMSASRNSW